MVLFTRFVRWSFALLLILHGFAHLPGVLGSWKIRTMEDVSFQPNALLTDASDTTVFLLGIVWFMAMAGFLAAGVALLARRAWWPHIALRAVLTSMIPAILWNQDARIGLVLNITLLVIVLAVIGWKRANERNHQFVTRHIPVNA